MPANTVAPIKAQEWKNLHVATAFVFALAYAALYFYMISGFAGPFAVDESVYIAMADAMAKRGDLAIQSNGGAPGAPSLPFVLSGYGADGRIYPQYPAGYAFIAAPFYAIAGVDGLFFLNSAAGLASIFFFHNIARRLYADPRIAFASVAIFAACTYFATYSFAIWPHALALALLLAAASATLHGAGGKGEINTRLGALALAGGLLALGATIRVSSIIFLAPIFIWLRLFGAPGRRTPALAFLAGAIPPLAISAWFNAVKYGAATPISYGNPSLNESLADYGPLAVATALGVAVLLAINPANMQPLAQRALATRNSALLFGAASFAVALFLHRPLSDFAHHLWTLLIDIQQYNGDYFHDALAPDANGFLTVFGLPKKALLQNMPFFVIALVAIVDFIRGRNMQATAFCFLLAAAPIAFFGLKQWHGGYALNMRFFFEAVPFLTILSAAAIAPLFDATRGAPKHYLFAAAAGCAGLLALQGALASAFPAYGIVIATHPPLIAAFVLLVACVVHIARPGAQSNAVLLIAAGVAVGAAAASNLGDLMLTKSMRRQSAMADAYFSSVAPKDSLIISFEEARLTETFVGGVSLLHPDPDEPQTVSHAVAAFDRAGRCVYVRKGEIAAWVAATTGLALTAAAANPPPAFDWFMTLAPARPGCQLP